MTAVLRPALPDDWRGYYGEPVAQTALEIDGAVCAIGLVRRQEGRLWGTLDTRPGVKALTMIRAIRNIISAYDEPVYVECQSYKHATAERLLKAIGFAPTEEWRNGMRVWRHG
jgi:hypothetical protein